MKKKYLVQIWDFEKNSLDEIISADLLSKKIKNDIGLESIYFSTTNEIHGLKINFIDKLENFIQNNEVVCIVVGGQTTLSLKKENDNYSKSVNFWQKPLILANKYNIPFILNEVSVDIELLDTQKELYSKLFLNVDYAGILNDKSEKLMREINFKNFKKINFLAERVNDYYSDIKKSNDNYLIFDYRLTNYESKEEIKIIKKFIKKISSYKKVYMIISGNKNQDRFINEIIQYENVYKIKLNDKEIIPFIKKSSGYIGSSLMAIIISLKSNINVISINYTINEEIKKYLSKTKNNDIEVTDLNELNETYENYFGKTNFKYISSSSNIEIDFYEKISKKINTDFNEISILKNYTNNVNKKIDLDAEYMSLYLKYNEVKEIYKKLIYKDNKYNDEYCSKEILYSNKVELNYNNIGKVAIHAHIFYPSVTKEFLSNFNEIKFSKDVYITTTTKEKAVEINNIIKKENYNGKIIINIVENKGRDILPFITTMKSIVNEYDYVCHIHSKKTKTTNYGTSWRKYLIKNLFGSKDHIEFIFKQFKNDNKLGIVFPDTFFKVSGVKIGKDYIEGLYNLCNKLNINKKLISKDMPFPAGSMFWARTDAIKPLIQKINEEEFEEETGQTDYTIAHYIERIFVILAISRGYKYLIINKEKQQD